MEVVAAVVVGVRLCGVGLGVGGGLYLLLYGAGEADGSGL